MDFKWATDLKNAIYTAQGHPPSSKRAIKTKFNIVAVEGNPGLTVFIAPGASFIIKFSIARRVFIFLDFQPL
jgi:hypothetical protein